jgi:biotin carboxylase
MEQSGLFVLDHTQVIPQLSYVGVVDPFSTGAALAAEIAKKGFKIIAIYSSDLEKLGNLQNLVPEGLNLSFESIVGYNDDLNLLACEIRKVAPRLVAILAGAETGVELADRLSSHFGLRTNGTDQSDARRNKYIMGETLRSAGIRAVKQLHSNSWDEIAAFLQDWQPDPYRVIVKPMDSAGSEDVTLCRSHEEVQRAFGHILGKVNGLGLVNNSVLVQEYLDGQEYVVDMVSRDGEHKLVAIWEYDRRPANGASFVLWGQQLMIMSDHPEIYNQLVEYQKRVITALGIRNGPSHGEVKWYKDAPILVEVGSRCHGSEGAWMPVSDGVLTYNQVGATVASFLSDDAFAQIPPLVSSPPSPSSPPPLTLLVAYCPSSRWSPCFPHLSQIWNCPKCQCRHLARNPLFEVLCPHGIVLKAWPKNVPNHQLLHLWGCRGDGPS